MTSSQEMEQTLFLQP